MHPPLYGKQDKAYRTDLREKGFYDRHNIVRQGFSEWFAER